MRSLYLRIWITVVAALALFALVSGWLVQRHLGQEREHAEALLTERVAAWGELMQRALPPADAPVAAQAQALRAWSYRLRVPMALDGVGGQRIATTESYARRDPAARSGDLDRRARDADDGRGLGGERGHRVRPGSAVPIRFDDGRTLWLMPPPLWGDHPMARAMHHDIEREGMRGWPHAGSDPRPAAGAPTAGDPGRVLPWPPRPGVPGVAGLPSGVALVALLALLFAAVAAGAWPVVRQLTRRLEALERGVEAFGRGALHERVAVEGRDEVAALATSFNRAASRIEALLRSHQSLLANASHELRSPLARLKMALAMLDEAPPARRDALRAEIGANIAELDALVEEVLLASRLDAAADAVARDPVDLLALAAEEAARSGAELAGSAAVVAGDERLLRRALRNLLENARRYGVAADAPPAPPADSGAATPAVEVTVEADAAEVRVCVCDRGPGVPEALRERIFEPFFRLPGHAEREGGVGLGLSLVRQIAERHGGRVSCSERPGGGICFTLALPATPPAPARAGGAARSPAAG